MTREEKLAKFWKENYDWLKGEITTNIARGQMRGYADDLVQEMVVSLYKMNEEKLDGMLENGKLKWYVLSGASLQLRSKTSPFWHIHRKEKMWAREFGHPGSDANVFETGEVYEEYDEEYYQCFKEALEEMHWYNKTLLDLYWYKGYTLTDLHEKYKISKSHLTKDLNKAIFFIREKCDCE